MDAGIADPEGNRFSAHTFKHAGASSAFFRGYSFDRITLLAGWATESTFARHYKCRIMDRAENLLPLPSQPFDPERDLELGQLEDEEK